MSLGSLRSAQRALVDSLDSNLEVGAGTGLGPEGDRPGQYVPSPTYLRPATTKAQQQLEQPQHTPQFASQAFFATASGSATPTRVATSPTAQGKQQPTYMQRDSPPGAAVDNTMTIKHMMHAEG
jgi:hypothetical protein